MTTVSIYDDIDPIKKETAAPVSLYDELDIPSTTNTNTNDATNPNTTKTNPSPTIPTVTATSTYPTNTNTKSNDNNNNNNTSNKIIIPQIINNPVIPPANDHIDPSLTGVPLQHLSTYKSHVLYVGGIQWWVNDADIRRTFDQFGTIVEVKIHADKVNGKSKGYGYVEFEPRELEAAVIAKQKLHGHILSDCRISVAFASPERAKGAEYTNTPVHIPRHKITHPISNQTTNNSNLSNPNSILPKLNVLSTHPRAHAHAHTHTQSNPNIISNHAHHSHHNVLAAINNARNTINNNTNILNNNRNNNNNNNNTNNNNSIGLLSKFTDQAQLLALLNKNNKNNNTNNNNNSIRSGSISMSNSGSRSPRSRSRSKHSRRRRHGNNRKKSRRHDRDNRRNRISGGGSGGGGGGAGGGGGDVNEYNKERERRKHKRRHRHRDKSDREYNRNRHRERRKRNRNVVNDSNENNNHKIPVTNITKVNTNVDQKNNQNE